MLEKRLQDIINLSELKSKFMPGKGTNDAFFILRRMEEEFREKMKSLCMRFVDLETFFC